ncbi:MAG: pseudouridine synthase [Agromyces sp.]
MSSEPPLNGQPEPQRLQKVLAAAGVASRRVCEDLIVAGRVSVNGQIVTELGSRVSLDDEVAVDGIAVELDPAKRSYVLNKPRGVVSTMRDERGRPDLRTFTDSLDERVYNVGRLDTDTSGLLLLTNDGDLAHVLAHPSFGVEKTYIATVRGQLAPKVLTQLKQGIELEDGPIAIDRGKILQGSSKQDQTLVEVTLHSVRNRIVRRMFEAVGHPVLELVRRQFGPIHLGTMKPGQLREVTSAELGALLTLAREAKAQEAK